MTDQITILKEPVADTYVALVRYLAKSCPSFSLVQRDEPSRSDEADALCAAIAPSLIREERTNSWPGTELLSAVATVRHYHTNASTLDVLCACPSLYAWCSPNRPEDLSFYLASGEHCLGSIAHERDSWLRGNPNWFADVAKDVPGLALADNLDNA